MDITIGALARASGVPAATLRTWERRYGFPRPERTNGKQRVYAPDVVERVRRVARAITEGHRPAQVMAASEEELEALLAAVGDDARADKPCVKPCDVPEIPEWWAGLARSLDGPALEEIFETEVRRLGLRRFLTETAGPFLVALGESWASGQVQPFEEHFASERLRDFLVRRWRPLSDQNRARVVVCATLPGERHVLGLHLVACVAASCGWTVCFLGAETPPGGMEASVRRTGAKALVVSVSRGASPVEAGWALGALGEALPEGVDLVFGGEGAPATAGKWRKVEDLEAAWLYFSPDPKSPP